MSVELLVSDSPAEVPRGPIPGEQWSSPAFCGVHTRPWVLAAPLRRRRFHWLPLVWAPLVSCMVLTAAVAAVSCMVLESALSVVDASPRHQWPSPAIPPLPELTPSALQASVPWDGPMRLQWLIFALRRFSDVWSTQRAWVRYGWS